MIDLYARYIRLDDVWREKDAALEDNAVLARQLTGEQRARAAAEDECRRLEEVWREKDAALDDNAVLARQLADEQRAHAAALDEYRKLERYCRSLEQQLAKTSD